MTVLPGHRRAGQWRPGRDRRAQRHRAHGGTPSSSGRSVAIVGGGIAGLSAAASLAERGVAVTLIEAQEQWGGRVRSWPIALDDGRSSTMSRGFHAFFRQYYQLRALLRRADPELRGLRAVDDYPLWHSSGVRDSFRKVPRTPPFNLLGFVLSSPSFPLRQLPRVNVEQALGLLDVAFPQTFSDFDGISAAELLDRLRFPEECRHLALEVFARSFFAPADEFAAGELVGMFHSYFVGSAEGLLFDVAADDFGSALWTPLAEWLERQAVDLRPGTEASGLTLHPEGVTVSTGNGEITADALILATDLRGTQQLLAHSTGFEPSWVESVSSLPIAPSFAVWRRWFDRPVRADSPDFLGTSGYGALDNISMIHQFETGARHWSSETGGSVVELHAYALPAGIDHADLRTDLDHQLLQVHPELRGAGVIGDHWLVRDDCPLIGPQPWHERPGVTTASSRVMLAGDGVRCPYPVALMERAATTGVMAANQLLGQWGVAGQDLWTTPTEPRLRWARPLHRLTQRSTRLSNT